MPRARLSFLHRALGSRSLLEFSQNPAPSTLHFATRAARRPWTCSAPGVPVRKGVSTAVLWPGPQSESGGCIDVARWHVLLVKRGKQPYLGAYSLPGGSLLDGEEVRAGARREVMEETGLVLGSVQGPALQQTPADGWLIHVCFALLPQEDPLPDVTAADDATDARFVRLGDIARLSSTTPNLAQSVYKLASAAVEIRSQP